MRALVANTAVIHNTENQEDLEKPRYDPDRLDKMGNGCLVILRRPRDFRSLCGKRKGVETKDLNGLMKLEEQLVKEYLNPKKRRFEQSVGQGAQVIAKKRNWSAPGPDRIANFWWKKVGALHAVVPSHFRP